MVHCLRFCVAEVLARGVVPEVDAPDGSGGVGFGFAVCFHFGCVPEVEGVIDEYGELEGDEPLELVLDVAVVLEVVLVVQLGWEEPGLLQEWVECLELVPVAEVLG